MRRVLRTLFGLGLACALAAPALAGQNTQAPQELLAYSSHKDDAPHPKGDRQRELRMQALEAKLNGKAAGKTHQVAKGQFVELERAGEDSIWTVTAQFGNSIHPVLGGTPGPLRNQIVQPNRQFDNTTIWTSDFNQAYYQNLLFSDAPGTVSFRNFYKELSSNRYTVNGQVEDWVQLTRNEAYYGSDYCGDIVCAQTWVFVRDAATGWYNAKIAAGWTPAQINTYLSKYDVWDRYDYDGDGNFNEPDGYIDHFQAIHAGEGEETGGGPQGTDAIWSHRWYAYYNLIGSIGPAYNPAGGVRIGTSNYWIGDYTVEPENGGVGVFAHEFGHDLGLPDLYDTSGNTGGAENSTGFWTLYSSGSYGSTGIAADGIGSKPIHMSAYEKIQLGWSNYEIAKIGQNDSIKLAPAETNTKQAQQLVVLLPDKTVVSNLGPPATGSYYYYSGSGNMLDNTMTRNVTLPSGAVTLTAKVRYSTELDYDYAYLTVNGAGVATNLSSATNPNGNNLGNGITGSTGNAWVTLTANLSAFAGQTVALGFRYKTDPAVAGPGFSVDDIAITSLAADGGEIDPGWSYNGFLRTTGQVSLSYFNAYFGEFRQFFGYDSTLQTGPYNFGFLDNPALQDWVEHFPYQPGLLMWYYDESFPDNNVGDHCLSGRCGGLFLPVDAHPDLLIRPDNGKMWRPRVQAYDSTFGLSPTPVITLHANSIAQTYGNLAPNALFDDTQSYWVAPNAAIGNSGWASVPLPGFGVTVRVVSVSAQGEFMQVQVAPK